MMDKLGDNDPLIIDLQTIAKGYHAADPLVASAATRAVECICKWKQALQQVRSEAYNNDSISFDRVNEIFMNALVAQQPPPCSPTLTECPRCHNDVSKCDGIFAAPQPEAPVPASAEPAAQQPPPLDTPHDVLAIIEREVAREMEETATRLRGAQQPEAPPTLADDELVTRLRNPVNWLRQEYGNWKDATSHYDRAPFEAAARIESDAKRIRKSESLRVRLADDLDRVHIELAASRERERALTAALRKVRAHTSYTPPPDAMPLLLTSIERICDDALTTPDSAKESK